MRLLLLVLVWVMIFSAKTEAHASDDSFYKLGPSGYYDKGRFQLYLFENDAAWLNGSRLEGDHDSVSLSAGDTVVVLFKDYDQVRGSFFKFRLDHLSSTKALITTWTYDIVRIRTGDEIKYSPGVLQSSETLDLDLSKDHLMLVDYGPNHVELGSGTTSKSKK